MCKTTACDSARGKWTTQEAEPAVTKPCEVGSGRRLSLLTAGIPEVTFVSPEADLKRWGSSNRLIRNMSLSCCWPCFPLILTYQGSTHPCNFFSPFYTLFLYSPRGGCSVLLGCRRQNGLRLSLSNSVELPPPLRSRDLIGCRFREDIGRAAGIMHV